MADVCDACAVSHTLEEDREHDGSRTVLCRDCVDETLLKHYLQARFRIAHLESLVRALTTMSLKDR